MNNALLTSERWKEGIKKEKKKKRKKEESKKEKIKTERKKEIHTRGLKCKSESLGEYGMLMLMLHKNFFQYFS